MIGEESGISGYPKEKGRDKRVAQEPGMEKKDEGYSEPSERIEDSADPKTIGDRVSQDAERGGRGHAGVAVGAEEIVVVGQEMGTDDEEVIAQPCDDGQDRARKTELKEGAEAVSGAGPEQPCNCGKDKDGGGLGEDHEREQNAESKDG